MATNPRPLGNSVDELAALTTTIFVSVSSLQTRAGFSPFNQGPI
jgi:hypothetical protein